MSKVKLSSDVPEEIAQMLGKGGKKRGKLSKTKKIIIAVAAISVAAAIVVSSVLVYAGNKSDEGETVYREYTVEKGDIIVGQTESSVITLDRQSVEFPVDAEILDIYVKAGSTVKEGDQLIKLSTDDIGNSIAEYKSDIDSAAATLEQAKLTRESDMLKAQQSLETSRLNLSLAEDKLNNSLEQAQLELNSKKKLA